MTASASTVREMPVLFHLMDVSRPKTPAAPAVLAPLPPAPVVVPPVEEPLIVAPPSAAEVVTTTQTQPEIVPAVTPPLETPIAETVSPAVVPHINSPEVTTAAVKTELSSETVAPQQDAPKLESAARAIAASQDETNTPEEAKVEPLTARQRAALREQKRTPPTGKDDWLRSHGKLLAMGFVVALVATIYAARANRPAAPANKPATEWPAAHPGDVAEHLVIELPPAHVHPTATLATAPAAAAAKSQAHESSPAVLPKQTTAAEIAHAPVDSQPRIELLAPTIPATSPPSSPATAATVPPTASNLFPWGQPGEPRVAARPEASAAVGAPAVAPPTTVAPQQGSMTLGPTANTPQYQYPQTRYQGLSQPLDGQAPEGESVPSGGSLYVPISAPTSPAGR